MLMGLSAVGNTPIGMLTGWSLPAWPATSPSMRWRVAWKSSMKTWASSRLVWTKRPTPVVLRSYSASMTPKASRFPAVRSSMGMPTRIGPRPGSPVMDMSPPRPWAIWSTPPRLEYGPVWPKPEMDA